MNKAIFVVILITLYAFIFQAAPWLGMSGDVILNMFLLSPFLVLFMVYFVLRYGEPSNHTFDERFYDDRENEQLGRL